MQRRKLNLASEVRSFFAVIASCKQPEVYDLKYAFTSISSENTFPLCKKIFTITNVSPIWKKSADYQYECVSNWAKICLLYLDGVLNLPLLLVNNQPNFAI